MDKFFFSERNVARQCGNLERLLNINSSNPEIRKKCKRVLVQQMQEVYKKYGKKRPKGMSINDFVDKLNKKSIDDCTKKLNQRKRKKKEYSTEKMGDYQRDRDRELYGKREMFVPDRPKHTAVSKARTNSGMPMYSNDGAGSSFAPLAQGQGEYITATGEMGGKMFFGNLEEQMGINGARSKEDLERRLLERQSEYSPRQAGGMGDMGGMGNMFDDPMGNMGHMGNIGNMGNMDMNQYMNNRNNIGGMNNNRPPDINFSLDGGPRKKEDFGMNSIGMNGMNGMDNVGFSGMDMNFGGMGNIGQMDMNFGGMDNNMNNWNNNGNNGNNNNNDMIMAMMQAMNNNGNNGNNPNTMAMLNMLNQMNNNNNNSSGIDMNNMNNMNNNFPANGMSDSEMKSGIDKIMSERQSLDNMLGNNKNSNKKFDPTVSPNMNLNMNMNNNNIDINQMLQLQKMQEMMSGGNQLNFKGRVQNNNTGRGLTDGSLQLMNTMNSEQLDNYLEMLKKKTLNNQMYMPNLSPQLIDTLDSSQLNKIIKKISSNLAGLDDNNDELSNNLNNNNDIFHKHSEVNLNPVENINNKKNESYRSDIQQLDRSKSEILDLIREMKQQEEKINKFDELENFNNEKPEKQEKKEVKREKENQFPIKTDDNDNMKPINIVIDSDLYTTEEYYNDYLIELKNKIENVVGVTLESVNFSGPLKNINSSNNIVYIKQKEEKEQEIDDNEILIEIPENNYSFKNLTNILKEKLDNKYKIYEDNNNFVSIESIDGNEFKLRNGPNSILKSLGFKKQKYSGSQKYRSENPHNIFKHDMYLFLENIVDDEPFCKINPNNFKPITKIFKNTPIEELSEFIIKFKTDKDHESENLFEFGNISHVLKLKFYTKSNQILKKNNQQNSYFKIESSNEDSDELGEVYIDDNDIIDDYKTMSKQLGLEMVV